MTKCQEGVTMYQEYVSRSEEGVNWCSENLLYVRKVLNDCQEGVTRYQKRATRCHTVHPKPKVIHN